MAENDSEPKKPAKEKTEMRTEKSAEAEGTPKKDATSSAKKVVAKKEKSEAAAKPSGPEKPAKSGKPGKLEKPAKAEKTAATAKAGKATKPAKVEVPVEAADDGDAGAEPLAEAEVAQEPSGPPPEPRVGLVFPAVVLLVQHAIAVGLVFSSTTPKWTYAGIGLMPILGAVFLVAWWLRSRLIPVRDRRVGLGLVVLALFLPVVLQRPIWKEGVFLLVYVLPTLTTGLVFIFLLTAGMRWAVRRKAAAGVIVASTLLYLLVRVTGVDGNMAPMLGWRWSAPPEAQLSADVAGENQVAELPESLSPEDWPGFRGDRRDGRNRVSTFGTDWENSPPQELWRRDIGLGWSSFTVIGDYCFTQEQRGEDETVVCYDANTGEQVWVNAIEARFTEVMGDGPRATPEYKDGKLFTQGALGDLQCIDASNGETIWRRNVMEDAGMKEVPQWGFSSSPLASGEFVLAYTGAGDGKSLIAYNQSDGEIAWTTGNGHNGYCSPQLGEVAGTLQILQNSNTGIEAFDPATGNLLWEQVWDIGDNPRVSQPYVMDMYNLYAGTGQRKGIRQLKVDKENDAFTVKTIYTSERFRPYFNDYVFHDGYLYGFDGIRFACMETTDGSVRFTGERWGGQLTLMNAMDMLVLLTEEGEVILVAAYPSFVDIRARMPALSSKTWNHPVVAQGKLFVRNDREAVCYQLPPAPVTEEPAAEGDAGEDEESHE